MFMQTLINIQKMKLDRRLNILIYLNHNWKDE